MVGQWWSGVALQASCGDKMMGGSGHDLRSPDDDRPILNLHRSADISLAPLKELQTSTN